MEFESLNLSMLSLLSELKRERRDEESSSENGKLHQKRREENMCARDKGAEMEERLNNLLIIFYIILNLINLIFLLIG